MEKNKGADTIAFKIHEKGRININQIDKICDTYNRWTTNQAWQLGKSIHPTQNFTRFDA